jgi:hypothetical protein
MALAASYYPMLPGIEYVYQPLYANEVDCAYEELRKFMEQYNRIVVRESIAAGFDAENTHVPKIQPTHWVQFDKKIIGFMSHGMPVYHRPLSLSDALHAEKLPVIHLQYHPDSVTRALYMKSPPKEDPYSRNIAENLYKHYLYVLLMGRISHYFSTYRNDAIRRKIRNAILMTDFNKNPEQFRDLIEKIAMPPEDKIRIRNFIDQFIHDHGDKSILLRQFMEAIFEFDNTVLLRFKDMSVAEIKKALVDICRRITTIGEPKVSEFPNIFNVCLNAGSYCRDGKLMINQANLDTLIDIIAHDARDETKWRRMFNPMVFGHNVVDFFKFIKHPDEKIIVELV